MFKEFVTHTYFSKKRIKGEMLASYDKNVEITYYAIYDNNSRLKYHRKLGPARIVNNIITKTKNCLWFNKDKESRLDGPSSMIKNTKFWSINGKHFEEENFWNV